MVLIREKRELEGVESYSGHIYYKFEQFKINALPVYKVFLNFIVMKFYINRSYHHYKINHPKKEKKKPISVITLFIFLFL